MIRVLRVGNLISAVRGIILITNSAHESQGCPLNQLFWESQILQLYVPVIEVWMEPDMTAAPNKTFDWMNIWKAFRSQALHFPWGPCVRGCIYYGLHSQCASSPRMTETNRSNFIKDMRCSDPVISHDGALSVPPHTLILCQNCEFNRWQSCCPWLRTESVSSPPIERVYLLPITALCLSQLHSYNTVFTEQNSKFSKGVPWPREIWETFAHMHTHCFVTKYGEKTKSRLSTSIKA